MIYREDYAQHVLGTTWSPLRSVISPCSSLEVGPRDEVFLGWSVVLEMRERVGAVTSMW